MKMMHYVKTIKGSIINFIINKFYQVCPCLHVYLANKKVKKKKETIFKDYLLDVDMPSKASLEDLYLEYTASIERRNRLEDKAKSLLISWTITSTIILGLPTMIQHTGCTSILKKCFTMSDSWVDITVAITCIFSVIYMFLAGLMVIQILTKDNQISLVSINDRKNSIAIYQAIKQNNYQNIIRNNKLSAAYYFLRNSFVCLVLIFFIVVLIG